VAIPLEHLLFKFVQLNREIMKAFFLTLFAVSLVQSAYAVDKKEAAAPAATATAAPAEVPKTAATICNAEVTYKWKRIAPPVLITDPLAAGKKGKGVYPAANPQLPDPDIYGPIESTAVSLGESGPIESEVRARIEAQIPSALTKAMTICSELHQNQGTCLSKKLGAVSTQLDRLDFETKKAIREQSMEDCKKDHGICISASKSEITCRLEVLPTPAPTEAPAAKETKKK